MHLIWADDFCVFIQIADGSAARTWLITSLCADYFPVCWLHFCAVCWYLLCVLIYSLCCTLITSLCCADYFIVCWLLRCAECWYLPCTLITSLCCVLITSLCADSFRVQYADIFPVYWLLPCVRAAQYYRHGCWRRLGTSSWCWQTYQRGFNPLIPWWSQLTCGRSVDLSRCSSGHKGMSVCFRCS